MKKTMLVAICLAFVLGGCQYSVAPKPYIEASKKNQKIDIQCIKKEHINEVQSLFIDYKMYRVLYNELEKNNIPIKEDCSYSITIDYQKKKKNTITTILSDDDKAIYEVELQRRSMELILDISEWTEQELLTAYNKSVRKLIQDNF